MPIDPRQFNLELERDEIFDLYFFYGEETFIIEEALLKLKDKVLGASGLSDFNLNVFYGGSDLVSSIRDAVETLPVMAARRLVIVKEVQELSGDQYDELLTLIEKPVPTASLVFVASKIDLRKKWFKLFDVKGRLVKIQKPFENQLNPWIQYIARKHKKTLTPESVEVLKEWVGPSLTDLDNEIRKVAQYIGSRKEIVMDDLKAVVTRTRIESVFSFANAMGRGDTAESFQLLAQLLDHGENEIAVLAMIVRHYRILMMAQEAIEEGMTGSQVAAKVGVHPLYVKEYIEQAKKLSRQRLVEIYDVLLHTDRALKSNPLSSHLWLENLILQSCGVRSSRPSSGLQSSGN